MPPSLNLHACFTPTGPSAISGPNEDKDTYSVGKFFKFIHNQLRVEYILEGCLNSKHILWLPIVFYVFVNLVLLSYLYFWTYLKRNIKCLQSSFVDNFCSLFYVHAYRLKIRFEAQQSLKVIYLCFTTKWKLNLMFYFLGIPPLLSSELNIV